MSEKPPAAWAWMRIPLLAITLWAGWPAVAAAGVALIQKKVGYAQGPTFALTFDSDNAAGNTIVVFAFWEDSTRAATVFDSQGNSYAFTPSVSNSWQPPDRGSLAQFSFATGIRPGPNTVTIEMQPDAGTAYHTGIGILEYSGLDPNPFDGTALMIAPDASNAAVTPPVSTSGPEDLLLGGFNDTNGAGTIDAGDGWTSQLINTPFYILLEDRVVLDAGSYQATATMPNGDADWVGVLLALKAAAPPDAGEDAGVTSIPREYLAGCGCTTSSRPALALATAAVLLVLVTRARRLSSASASSSRPGACSRRGRRGRSPGPSPSRP